MISKLRGTALTAAISAVVGAVVVGYALLIAEVSSGEFATGLIPAMATGVAAMGLVLIYRTVRVINFSQMALGIIAVQLFYEFYTRGILPFWVAWPVGVIGGTIIALIIGVVASTLFFKHPRLTLMVVTVFMTSIVAYAAGEIQKAFTAPGETFDLKSIPLPGSFLHREIGVLGVTPIRYAHVFSFVTLLAILVGLAIFFRRSRVGIAVRASAENSDRASLLGINVKMLNVMVWGIVGLTMSIASLANTVVEPYVPGVVIPLEALLLPLTAAVIARMQSLPMAFVSAMGLVILRQAFVSHLEDAALLDIIVFVIVLVGLLFQRQKVSRVDDSVSWKAVREFRPIPRELLALPAIARTRRAFLLIGGVIVLAFPWLAGQENAGVFSAVWTGGIVAISLVILTGWTGQISLGHVAFLGTGALVAAKLTSQVGVHFFIAIPIAGLAAAVLAILIGLPALRIRGLFLAVTTFALAVAFPTLLFNDQFLSGIVPESIDAPTFLMFSLEDPRTQYYLTFLLFLIVVVMVRTLRKSRAGRLLIALRDNEAGVQAFGVDVFRTRLMAFAISGFLTGVGGAIVVHLQRGMDVSFYSAQLSFGAFQLVIIGGVSSIAGAFLGSLYFIGGGVLFPGLLTILTGVGGLALMMAIPGGLAQILFGMRDAVLRVVALRRHIVVPSLFADYSPEAWEKRLTPLAATAASQGLGALGADQRYSMPSRLYGKAASEA